jgi:hypothetical protein
MNHVCFRLGAFAFEVLDEGGFIEGGLNVCYPELFCYSGVEER